MQANEDRLLLSKEDVAALLGIGRRTVERLTARGVLRAVRPAGMRCVRYRRDEVQAWVAAGCPDRRRR